MPVVKVTKNVPALFRAYEVGHRRTSRGVIIDIQVTYEKWGETPIQLLLWIA